jgi:hypothetical protein
MWGGRRTEEFEGWIYTYPWHADSWMTDGGFWTGEESSLDICLRWTRFKLMRTSVRGDFQEKKMRGYRPVYLSVSSNRFRQSMTWRRRKRWTCDGSMYDFRQIRRNGALILRCLNTIQWLLDKRCPKKHERSQWRLCHHIASSHCFLIIVLSLRGDERNKPSKFCELLYHFAR